MVYKDIETIKNKVKNYISLSDSGKLPLLINVENRNSYLQLIDSLSIMLDTVRVSAYIMNEDTNPCLEKMFSYISLSNRSNMLLGFCTHLKMVNSKDRNSLINTLKSLFIHEGKLVVVCFQLKKVLDELIKMDRRIESRIIILQDNSDSKMVLNLINPKIDVKGLGNIHYGYKSFLKEQEINCDLENFVQSNIYYCADLDPMITVQKIDSTYKIISMIDKDIPNILDKHIGNEKEWQYLLQLIKKHKKFEKVVIDIWGNNSSYTLLMHSWNEWDNLKKWLFFITVKAFGAPGSYIYNAAVSAGSVDSFVKNIYRNILDINYTCDSFRSQYKERKCLIEKLDDINNVIEFCKFALIKGADAIYYLTDTSTCEKQAIITCLSAYKKINEDTKKIIRDIYPDLGKYLNQFYFNNPLLDSYFQEYKYQKVNNKIYPEFLEIVNQQAEERTYNLLPSRNSVFENIDKTDAPIYFIDALGMEFIGYIVTLCLEAGLETNVRVCRANIPTTTFYNKDFLKNSNSFEIRDLDELKHSGEGDFNFTVTKLPYHLAEELRIIKDIINKNIMAQLVEHDKVIIVSDHGASRLVVINEQQYSFDVPSNGTHGGRCCIYNESIPQVDYATEENGQYVLASYDRFKGGRAARVETHGGATLEEVIVPIIEISRSIKNVEIKLMNDTILVSYRRKAILEVFATKKLEKVNARINGKFYSSTKEENNIYTIPIEDIKNVGSYEAEIFYGSNFLRKLKFQVKKEISSDNKLGLKL